MHSKLPKSAADERQAKNNLAKFSQHRRKPSSPVGCANGCNKEHKKSLFSISLRNCFSFTLWLAPATIHQLVKRRNWDRDIKTAVAWLTMVVPSGLPPLPFEQSHPNCNWSWNWNWTHDDVMRWHYNMTVYAALVPVFVVVLVPPSPMPHSLLWPPSEYSLLTSVLRARNYFCSDFSSSSSFVVSFCKYKKWKLHN